MQNMSMIIMVVILGAFMYFGMMRPQKKQQQKRQAMLNSMKKGQKVITIGGLHGVIDSIDKANGTVDLDLDGIYLTFNLTAIRTVNEPAAPAAAKPAAKAAAKPEAGSDKAEASSDKPYSEPSSDDDPDSKD